MESASKVISQNNLSSKYRQSKPEESGPSARQKKLVSAMWLKMNLLYRHKWAAAEGHAVDSQGRYSYNFLLWCDKTAHLTDDNWRFAFQEIEREMGENKAAGKDSWPPAYPEFIAMSKQTMSPDGSNSAAYLKYNPDHPQHPEFGKDKKLIGSDEYKRKNQSASELHKQRMNDLWNSAQ